MFGSCTACGAFAPEAAGFERDGDDFVCPKCGHRRTLSRGDLFVVFGPSGCGKSSLWNYVLTRPDRPDLVYLDSDILLTLAQHGSEGYVAYWLFICACISQSGRPVLLFTTIQPDAFETSGRRDLFREIHYLGLYCTDEELERRLRTRPGWRRSSRPEVIVGMQEWNRAIRDRAWGYSELDARGLFSAQDTTGKSLDESATEFFDWLGQRLD